MNDMHQEHHEHTEHSAAPVSHAPTAGDNKMILGILSYLGPLVIVSLLIDRETPFIKFHIRQGLVLFCGEIILSILSSMLWPYFWRIGDVLHLVVLVYAILGIVNVVQGKEKELPFIGHLAKHFPV